MAAFLAILKRTGITDTSGTYELASALRPRIDSGNLVATDTSGNLQGDDLFVVKGTATTAPYDRWVPVDSYWFNVRSADIAGGSECVVFCEPSVITPKMAHACAVGRTFPYLRLEIELGATGSKKRLSVTMYKAKVVDYRSFSGTVGDGQNEINTTGNVDKYTFRFDRCEWGHINGEGNVMNAKRWDV